MITTVQELNYFIEEDKKANLWEPDMSAIKYLAGIIYQRTDIASFEYLKSLRKYEYRLNCRNKSFLGRIKLLWAKWRWNKLGLKMCIEIGPNMVGPGLRILHSRSGGVIINCVSMGACCSVTAGVVIGNKDSQDNRAVIGNNVELTLGSKIIGKVNIGDNVIVAPNSVVIKDIPSNAIVSGIPAKIIKYKKL